jgi:hypothetical protein
MKFYTAVFCIFFVFTQSRADEFSIIVEGVPRPVTMSFPPGFRLAATTPEKELRQISLEAFRKIGPSFYNEILLQKWAANDSGLPNIVVGSVASMAARQGQMTLQYWQSLKAIYAGLSKKNLAEMIELVRSRLEATAQVTDMLVWSEIDKDPNTIIVFSHSQIVVNGERLSIFTGQKTILHGGYAVFAQVSVDSSRPNVLKELKDFLDSIGIESI